MSGYCNATLKSLFSKVATLTTSTLPHLKWAVLSEYVKVLSQKFPQKDRELQVITNVYVQARYGRSPTTNEEFEAAQEARQRIKLAS